jgi:hypothetical protein
MTRVIRYEDLVLAIEPDQGESYRVRALSSPYGLTAAPFALSFCRKDLEAMIQRVGDRILLAGAAEHGPPRHLTVPKLSSELNLDLHETGARLFRALFHETIGEIYLLSRGRAESLPDRGLRIRLVLPSDSDGSALLQALPWELLYCEKTSDFLARSVLTPVVRQLVIPQVSAPFPPTTADRVRILIAVSTPFGVHPLDEVDERARILEAWCRQQGAEVELLRQATISGLYEALRSKHYQVVHFIAHGTFDTLTGVGSLLLENAEHEVHMVSGNALAETLRASRELRLVFLNSCKSASLGYRHGQDPLLGVASALVRRGVPAVLAMQFPISDVAARTFSEAVYRSLACGSSLEAAVGDGRLALHQADSDSWEWVTPALLTALSGAEVFQPLCSAVEDRTRPKEEAVSRVVKLLVARSYESARQVVESCLEDEPERADLHYYRALALLGGRRPRFLKGEEVRQIEASARRVLDLPDCAAHHLCLLAFLYKDFYLDNHLVPPPPGYEALLGRAAAAPSQTTNLTELARLVPGTGGVLNLVAGRARSDSL